MRRLLTTMSTMMAVALAEGCSTPDECSLGGKCVDGRCVCWPTWKGPNCSELNLMPSPNIFAWYRPGNQSSWGGSVVERSGVYHMFASDITAHCGLDTWRRNSRIVHLTADVPEGPYREQSAVLAPFAHNPTVHIAPDGTWLLLHIGHGVSLPFLPVVNGCTNGTTPTTLASAPASSEPPGARAALGDRVAPALLYSTSGPDGPWESLKPDPFAWGCNNPALHIFANGSALLVCKVPMRNLTCCAMQIATAPSWRGPYRIVAHPDVYGEDPFVFRQPEDGHLHMLLHTMIHGLPKIRTTAWSRDGISWTPAFVAYQGVNYSDTHASFGVDILAANGTHFTAARRERHQVLLREGDGAPTYLFNGVTKQNPDNMDFSFTAAQPLAVHPLRFQ